MVPPSTRLLSKAAAQASRLTAALHNESLSPLVRTIYALLASGRPFALLGLGYWVLAAKTYSPADVGQNWAVILALTFVGGVTMPNAILVRCIPQVAQRTRALVAACYGIGASSTALLALAFLLTLSSWGPSFQLLHGWRAGLWFLTMAVSWNIMNQQEGALTGLRRAGWLPMVYIVFGFTRLVLLVVLATSLPRDGIMVSWFIPVMLSLIPMNAFIFGKLIPLRTQANAGLVPEPGYRELARHAAGGHLGGVLEHAAISLIPVIVAAHLAPVTNAYFQMAWALSMLIDLPALTLSDSLTVTGAFNPPLLAESTRAALRRIYVLLIPIIVLVVVCAPFALRFLGHGYAAKGGPLLQVLALAALPKAVIELYVGVLRAQSRTSLILLIQGVRFVGTLILVLIFADPARLYSVGLVILGVSLGAAALIYPCLGSRPLWQAFTDKRGGRVIHSDHQRVSDESEKAARRADPTQQRPHAPSQPGGYESPASPAEKVRARRRVSPEPGALIEGIAVMLDFRGRAAASLVPPRTPLENLRRAWREVSQAATLARQSDAERRER